MIRQKKLFVCSLAHWPPQLWQIASVLVIVLLIFAGHAVQNATAHTTYVTQPADAFASFQTANDATMGKMMTAMNVKLSGNIDRDFVAMMIPHHQGAIDMAQAELHYGHNSQLLNIARGVVVEEQTDIATMHLALASITSVPSNSSEEAALQADNNTAMTRMMAAMDVKSSGNIDKSFIALMIPHHQGAIAMAQFELLYGHYQPLLNLSQDIIVTQFQEITAMEQAVGEPVTSPVS